DEMGLGQADLTIPDPSLEQWADLLAGPLLQRLCNDLEAPAFDFCPRLADLHRKVQQSLGQIVRMSGSGSSLFSLYDELSAAQQAVACIDSCYHVQSLAVQIAPTLNDDLR